MHLKLRHLAVFHAVMEEGSISKAAERLGLTQPAVSIALAKFEEILGYSLFVRSKGYFVPKPEAKQLLEDAELAILAFEKFAARAQQIGEGSEGLVRVGAIGSTAIYFMPEIIAQFAAIRDRVEVQLQVRSSAQIANLVGNGQIDIGVVEAPAAGQSIDAVNFEIPCVCILRRDDPLAAEPFLAPEHFADRRLLSIGEDHPLERKVRTAFLSAGVPWRIEIRCYFFAVMRRLVSKGAGLAIVDAINGCIPLNDDVIWRPFRPSLKYELAVVLRTGAELQAPTLEFMEMTTKMLRNAEQLDILSRQTR